MSLRNRSIFADHDAITSFVTTTVMNFEKIFTIDDSYFELLIDSLKFVLNKCKADLISYVLMPDHDHLIVHIDNVKNLSSLMRDFKKYTSVRIRQKLEDDNILYILERLKYYASGKKNQVFKLWMDRFDDVMIYSEKVLKIKMEYIHLNPVRKGLVVNPEDWKYSSYRNYLLNDNSVIQITPPF